jgi:hypothetical protein
MEKDFPEDKIIRNLTTFHFMDIRKYNIPAYKVMNYMNEHGYLFSSDNKTSNEGINFPEFIELTPPPREYWDDFSNTLRKALT